MKTVEQNVEVGIVIGRFQVPSLHEAHKQVIQQVLDNHPRVLIFLGLSPCKCTYNNPLDFQTRKAMIEQTFPTVEVHYIEDMPGDEIWSKELDKQIGRALGPGQKCVLYGSRDSFVPLYNGKFPTVSLAADRIVSGKEIRKNVGIKSKNDPKFREGVIWGVENTWPRTLPTVDIAIVDRQNQKVLLARKTNETKLRFVGGFAEPDSATYEADASREVLEETGLEVSAMKYLGSAKIKDWRYGQERDKIKTLFFVADYLFGAAKANDDIAEVQWVSFTALNVDIIKPEHVPLMEMLLEHLELNRDREISIEEALVDLDNEMKENNGKLKTKEN
jgi:bifunctional NMN adenylyltransferase/nudix hydrolase